MIFTSCEILLSFTAIKIVQNNVNDSHGSDNLLHRESSLTFINTSLFFYGTLSYTESRKSKMQIDGLTQQSNPWPLVLERVIYLGEIAPLLAEHLVYSANNRHILKHKLTDLCKISKWYNMQYMIMYIITYIIYAVMVIVNSCSFSVRFFFYFPLLAYSECVIAV